MSITIEAPLQRLHQLAWQPGAWMHKAWWQKLELTSWQESYQRFPACRAALDRLIVQRRDFPQTVLPAQLTQQQRQLLLLEPQLMRLCTALGLLAFSCPDYLLIGSWRRRLMPILGDRGCDQLLALGAFHTVCAPDLAAEQIVEQALERGLRWMRAETTDCPVWRTLGLILPPGAAESAPTLGYVIPWLLRIGRFL